MNRVVRLRKRWYRLFESQHRWYRWFPLGLLVLILAVGFIPAAQVVQARDAGTGQSLQSYFTLEIIPPAAPFCLGSTKPVQAIVRQVVAGGAVQVGTPTIQYSYSESVLENVSNSPSAFAQGAVLREQTFSFKGRAIGSGLIEITAIIETSTMLVTDEEVLLPVKNSPVILSASIPVEVIPCDYDLTIGMSWVTQAGTAQVIVSYGLPKTRIRFNRETNGMLPVGTFFKMSSSANRILGCRGVSVNHFSSPENLNGQRLENGYVRLELEIYPQGADVMFSCDRSPSTDGRIRSCKDYPDGRCAPDIRPDDFWSVETLRVDLAADGESFVIPVKLTHARGQATGVATFTLTPVTQ